MSQIRPVSIGNDFCRCLDLRCTARHECLRYLLRNDIGQRTPITQSLAGLNDCVSLRLVERGEWIRWRGGSCPVDPETKVQVMFADRKLENANNGSAKDFGWGSDVNEFAKIVAFRVLP